MLHKITYSVPYLQEMNNNLTSSCLISGVIAPIPIGFAVLVDHLVGVPFTGASMNPARSFGPALVSGHWGRAHIIYWFGPCFGAALASGIYRYVLMPGTPQSNNFFVLKACHSHDMRSWFSSPEGPAMMS